MHKTDLVQFVADRTDLSRKDVATVLDAVLEAIVDSVADGNKVTLIGFGSFEARHRKGRVGRNPKTGEAISIPAKVAPTFTAGKDFKNKVI